MIEIKQARKVFSDKLALSIDDLTIRKGECVGIVGNNGAGKTTLFRSMLDLIKLDEGQVLIDGQAVYQSEHWKNLLNSFIDESFLIQFLKPVEFLEFVGKTMDLTASDIQVHLSRFKELVNADITENRKLIRDLSTGSKIRVGLLSALMGDASYLLLDEPFAHLDPSSQARLRATLQNVHSQGKTIILSSHNLQNVLDVCTRVVLIEAGKVLMDKSVDQQAIEELSKYFEG